MGVEFLHGGMVISMSCRRKGRDVVGAAAGENVNERKASRSCSVSTSQDDRWFSLRCALPKEFDVLHLNTARHSTAGFLDDG